MENWDTFLPKIGDIPIAFCIGVGIMSEREVGAIELVGRTHYELSGVELRHEQSLVRNMVAGGAGDAIASQRTVRGFRVSKHFPCKQFVRLRMVDVELP